MILSQDLTITTAIYLLELSVTVVKLQNCKLLCKAFNEKSQQCNTSMLNKFQSNISQLSHLRLNFVIAAKNTCLLSYLGRISIKTDKKQMNIFTYANPV